MIIVLTKLFAAPALQYFNERNWKSSLETSTVVRMICVHGYSDCICFALQTVLDKLHLSVTKKAKLSILENVNGLVKPGRYHSSRQLWIVEGTEFLE